jgi:hypothetical protein
VSGHFAINLELLERYAGKWHFLTVLRHPVDRWFSNYFFNRYKRSSHFATTAQLTDYALSSPGRASARTYVRLFGGWKAGADSAECIERAKRTLDHFDIVGTVEHTALLRKRLQESLDISSSLDSRNLNPIAAKDQRERITAEVQERVTRECADDMVVYRHAVKLAGVLSNPG